jgi:ATP-dependent protease ClpP protease subunit
MIKKHVLANTKIPAELYKKHEPDDWYMCVDDALKYGVIDKITSGVNGEIELSELEGMSDEE